MLFDLCKAFVSIDSSRKFEIHLKNACFPPLLKTCSELPSNINTKRAIKISSDLERTGRECDGAVSLLLPDTVLVVVAGQVDPTLVVVAHDRACRMIFCS